MITQSQIFLSVIDRLVVVILSNRKQKQYEIMMQEKCIETCLDLLENATQECLPACSEFHRKVRLNPQAPVAQKITDEVVFRRFQGGGLEVFLIGPQIYDAHLLENTD